MARKKFHFIVADTDPESSRVIRKLLLERYPDAGVSFAMDGREALAMYEKTGADLLIVDYDLPELDTLILQPAWKAKPQDAPPLVMISNHPAFEHKLMAPGDHWFVNKSGLVEGLTPILSGLSEPGSTGRKSSLAVLYLF